MNIFATKESHKNLHAYPHKRKVLYKFLLVVFVLLSYFAFISYKYGLENGFAVTLLTWSFFVLGTPIADAGFLIDFPFRLITRIKMLYSEMTVWVIAISTNTYFFLVRPEMYEKTKLLSLFKDIIAHPYPFWGIFLLSAMGTFLSVRFGDELLDVSQHTERKHYHKHRKKYRFIAIAFLFALALTLYYFLLKKLGINLPKI